MLHVLSYVYNIIYHTYLPYVPHHRLCSPPAPLVQSSSVLLCVLFSGVKIFTFSVFMPENLSNVKCHKMSKIIVFTKAN